MAGSRARSYHIPLAPNAYDNFPPHADAGWFPLYDRNPQTFVPNIFWAKPGDYKKAVQRVFHSTEQESFIELPLVEMR